MERLCQERRYSKDLDPYVREEVISTAKNMLVVMVTRLMRKL